MVTTVRPLPAQQYPVTSPKAMGLKFVRRCAATLLHLAAESALCYVS